MPLSRSSGEILEKDGKTERSEFEQFKSWTRGPAFSCQALAKHLKENSTLKNLNLMWNKLGDEGAKAWCLARMVRKKMKKGHGKE